MRLNDFYLHLLTAGRVEADPPKESAHVRPEIRTSSPESLRAFLDGARGDRRYVAWLVLASTGMRRGEVLGFRWADIDVRAGQHAVPGAEVPTQSARGGTGRDTGRPYEPDEVSREFDREDQAAGRTAELAERSAPCGRRSRSTRVFIRRYVSGRLGHSTIAITLDTYSNVTPRLQCEAADQLAAVIFGASGLAGV